MSWLNLFAALGGIGLVVMLTQLLWRLLTGPSTADQLRKVAQKAAHIRLVNAWETRQHVYLEEVNAAARAGRQVLNILVEDVELFHDGAPGACWARKHGFKICREPLGWGHSNSWPTLHW